MTAPDDSETKSDKSHSNAQNSTDLYAKLPMEWSQPILSLLFVLDETIIFMSECFDSERDLCYQFPCRLMQMQCG